MLEKLKAKKRELYIICKNSIDQTINANNKSLKQLSDAIASESKSTAGDKHETGRAMINLEQENISKQIDNTLEQKTILDSIDIETEFTSVRLGSLVITDKINFFFSIAKGKVNLNGEDFYIVSLSSPIGRKFTKAKKNEVIEFNGSKYTIKEII